MVLFFAILGLRLTGQGLLSLTASTTMARVFGEGRGKALSVSGLGYPLGPVKGTVATFAIFGTALGTLLLGWLLQRGVTLAVILPACTLLGAAAIAISLYARSQLRHANKVRRRRLR